MDITIDDNIQTIKEGIEEVRMEFQRSTRLHDGLAVIHLVEWERLRALLIKKRKR